MKKLKGWWFSNNDKKLGYGDGRIIRAGITHKVKCEPVLCQSGLHASKRIIDALQYAPGHYVWRVELSGEIKEDYDKAVATQRKYLWGMNCEAVLFKFARMCALDVIDKWNAPDIVIQFLKTGDENLRDAAGAAAGAAAWDAAWDAAWAAAGDAAWAAVRAAAMAAAGDKQNKRLYRMIMKTKKRIDK